MISALPPTLLSEHSERDQICLTTVGEKVAPERVSNKTNQIGHIIASKPNNAVQVPVEAILARIVTVVSLDRIVTRFLPGLNGVLFLWWRLLSRHKGDLGSPVGFARSLSLSGKRGRWWRREERCESKGCDVVVVGRGERYHLESRRVSKAHRENEV